MIPDRKDIEQWYEHTELEVLDEFRSQLAAISDTRKRNDYGRRLLRTLWPDELEYISKTAWITTKDRGIVLFKPNYAQQRFYKDVVLRCREENRMICGIILKARQLGFSTFVQLWMYEQCVANRHRSSLTISFDEVSTQYLFTKAKLIRAREWFPHPTLTERRETISMTEPHGSTFDIRTAGNLSAGRSTTIHHLHCSEIPMWENPDETLLAATNAMAVRPGNSIILESTARGAQGIFYDMWMQAKAGENDYVPFFAPWFWDEEYKLDFHTEDSKNRFMQLMSPKDREHMKRFSLTPEQMHWRAWTIKNKCQGSDRKFQQEYPAEADEAFLTTGSPAFNPEAVRNLSYNATAPLWRGDIIITKQEASYQ